MGQEALALLETWGLWGAVAVLFLEGMGLPFPVEAAFLGVGLLLRNGTVQAWHVIAVCWLGALAGNLVGYIAAVWGGRPVLERLTRLFRVRPERLRRLELWVQRNGMTALLITRLTHWGFAPALWLAGMMRLPWRSVVAVMIVGDLIWVTAWVLLGSSLLSTNPLHVGVALLALAVAAVLLRRAFRPPDSEPESAPDTAAGAAASATDRAAAASAGTRFRRDKQGDA